MKKLFEEAGMNFKLILFFLVAIFFGVPVLGVWADILQAAVHVLVK